MRTDPKFNERRVALKHSGSEDGLLWYVVDGYGEPVSGDGWHNREDAEAECKTAVFWQNVSLPTAS